jgi:hypothetical protein
VSRGTHAHTSDTANHKRRTYVHARTHSLPHFVSERHSVPVRTASHLSVHSLDHAIHKRGRTVWISARRHSWLCCACRLWDRRAWYRRCWAEAGRSAPVRVGRRKLLLGCMGRCMPLGRMTWVKLGTSVTFCHISATSNLKLSLHAATSQYELVPLQHRHGGSAPGVHPATAPRRRRCSHSTH